MSKNGTVGRPCESAKRIAGAVKTGCLLCLCAVGLLGPAAGTSRAAAMFSGYAGASLGLATSKVDRGHAEFGSPDMSPNETAWRLFGGARYEANLGVEVGYINFGKIRVTEQVFGDYFETKMTGFELTPVGFLPIYKGFSAFAKGGLIFWSSDLTYGTAETVDSTAEETGSSPVLGLGAEYNIGRYIRLRGEFSQYFIDKTKAGSGDVFNISVGVLVAIGRK